MLLTLYCANYILLHILYMFNNYIFYFESLTIINNKILYIILKVFNKLVNINNCRIINANKIYYNIII